MTPANRSLAPIRIFVGADRSQRLALKVLEHSIRRHASCAVELRALDDVRLSEPEDPRLRQRTGFSFARFAIPALAGRQGRAIYMDADMLVFRDVAEVWSMPFDGAKLICQEAPSANASRSDARRPKQCSVMLLNCDELDWNVEEIVQGLGVSYTYEELMQDLCILSEDEVNYTLPTRWNSLEHYDRTTCLLHYTDMPAQPWVCADNPNGWLWTREVALMLSTGALTREELSEEVRQGYLRPSFLSEVESPPAEGMPPAAIRREFRQADSKAGFIPHAEVMAAHRELQRLISSRRRQTVSGVVKRLSIAAQKALARL